MKLRHLLPCAFMAATLSASAAFPLFFRDSGNIVDGKINPEAGGHFEFPLNENGEPLFNEDGSITARVNEFGGGGIWLRTKKIEENCPAEYCIFAMDYKSNRSINNLVVFHHEYAGRNDVDNILGADLISVSPEWQTVYLTFNRGLNNWGFDVANEKNYLWISSNDENAKAEGWEITFKNIRLLTLAEASEECKDAPVVTGDIPEYIWKPNGDFASGYDEIMDCMVYTRAEVLNQETQQMEPCPNPLIWTANIIRPRPAEYSIFAFDYKLTGANTTPNIFLTGFKSAIQVPLEGLGDEDPYAAEWKTVKFDLSDDIKATNWGQTFGCGDWLQVQFKNIEMGQMLWVQNPRWISVESAGIENIAVDAERPADNRIFNLLGIECKGDLTPGLYIQNGKKFIVK